MYQKALESPGLISLVKPMKMFHPLTIFSADKNWSIAFPDRCGELANKNAMNCHQHSSRQPLFAIFASFWKSRENLVNKANIVIFVEGELNCAIHVAFWLSITTVCTCNTHIIFSYYGSGNINVCRPVV